MLQRAPRKPIRIDRIPRPVQCRSLPQHRPPAAVDRALDYPQLRIIVRSTRILIHIKTCKPPHPFAILRILRIRQPHQVEDRQPLRIMLPVHHHRKLFVVHPLARKRNILRLRQRVLPDMPLVGFPVHLPNPISPTHRMQMRPVVYILNRIVRPIIRTPSRHAQQKSLVVKIAIEKSLTSRRVLPNHLSLQQRPLRSIHRSSHLKNIIPRQSDTRPSRPSHHKRPS